MVSENIFFGDATMICGTAYGVEVGAVSEPPLLEKSGR